MRIRGYAMTLAVTNAWLREAQYRGRHGGVCMDIVISARRQAFFALRSSSNRGRGCMRRRCEVEYVWDVCRWCGVVWRVQMFQATFAGAVAGSVAVVSSTLHHRILAWRLLSSASGTSLPWAVADINASLGTATSLHHPSTTSTTRQTTPGISLYRCFSASF